jgi:hypothetical protein
MQARIGVILAAVMLLPLALVGGSVPARTVSGLQAPAPRPVSGTHPHPCTPYAGCTVGP